MKWVSSGNSKWIEASFWTQPWSMWQLISPQSVIMSFLIFRFLECDKWVNSWPSDVYLICFHQAGRAHLHNLIHLNEVFGWLMDFPSSPASHLAWTPWLEPFRRVWGSQVAATWWAPLVPPHGNEKSHFILLPPRKEALSRPAQTSHTLQLPLLPMVIMQ